MEFEKLTYESYEKKSPKNDPTDSYFYLARHIATFMMRDDALNLHVYPVRTQMNGMQQITTLHVYSKDKRELKYFLVDKALLHELIQWVVQYYSGYYGAVDSVLYLVLVTLPTTAVCARMIIHRTWIFRRNAENIHVPWIFPRSVDFYMESGYFHGTWIFPRSVDISTKCRHFTIIFTTRMIYCNLSHN